MGKDIRERRDSRAGKSCRPERRKEVQDLSLGDLTGASSAWKNGEGNG